MPSSDSAQEIHVPTLSGGEFAAAYGEPAYEAVVRATGGHARGALEHIFHALHIYIANHAHPGCNAERILAEFCTFIGYRVRRGLTYNDYRALMLSFSQHMLDHFGIDGWIEMPAIPRPPSEQPNGMSWAAFSNIYGLEVAEQIDVSMQNPPVDEIMRIYRAMHDYLESCRTSSAGGFTVTWVMEHFRTFMGRRSIETFFDRRAALMDFSTFLRHEYGVEGAIEIAPLPGDTTSRDGETIEDFTLSTEDVTTILQGIRDHAKPKRISRVEVFSVTGGFCFMTADERVQAVLYSLTETSRYQLLSKLSWDEVTELALKAAIPLLKGVPRSKWADTLYQAGSKASIRRVIGRHVKKLKLRGEVRNEMKLGLTIGGAQVVIESQADLDRYPIDRATSMLVFPGNMIPPWLANLSYLSDKGKWSFEVANKAYRKKPIPIRGLRTGTRPGSGLQLAHKVGQRFDPGSYTFGVEFEMITRIAHNKMVEFLKRRGFMASRPGNWGPGPADYWQVKTDASLRPSAPTELGAFDAIGPDGDLLTPDPGTYHGVEICTPALYYGPSGFKGVRDLLKHLQPNAWLNNSCGLHVHVMAPLFVNGTYGDIQEAIRRLAELWMRVLPTVATVISPHRLGHNYSIPTADENHYSMVNLGAMNSHGTVEFRAMEGTLDPAVVLPWISFCVSVVKYACDLRKPLPTKPITLAAKEWEEGKEVELVERTCNFIKTPASTKRLFKNAMLNAIMKGSVPAGVVGNHYKGQSPYNWATKLPRKVKRGV